MAPTILDMLCCYKLAYKTAQKTQQVCADMAYHSICSIGGILPGEPTRSTPQPPQKPKVWRTMGVVASEAAWKGGELSSSYAVSPAQTKACTSRLELRMSGRCFHGWSSAIVATCKRTTKFCRYLFIPSPLSEGPLQSTAETQKRIYGNSAFFFYKKVGQ